jgi:hypothetical protein
MLLLNGFGARLLKIRVNTCYIKILSSARITYMGWESYKLKVVSEQLSVEAVRQLCILFSTQYVYDSQFF